MYCESLAARSLEKIFAKSAFLEKTKEPHQSSKRLFELVKKNKPLNLGQN